MRKLFWKSLNAEEKSALKERPAITLEPVFQAVKEVLHDVKNEGDEAVRKFTQKFDGVMLHNFRVSEKAIQEACNRVPEEVKQAFCTAFANIEKFHKAQMGNRITVETMSGVTCFQEARAIESVGLYIPGGKAQLPSTVLMLGIPARLAGCKRVVLCSPPQRDTGLVADNVLYAAQLCGITEIFQIGGAQAIAAMGYGTKTVPRVHKIFGPGNQYVTAAKMLLSIDPNGAAMDMPAGPTEVLVLADDTARPDFVAADLLSQAEHGEDSQAVLVCLSEHFADAVFAEIQKQLQTLSRAKVAERALENSFILIAPSVKEGLSFANEYAPEHLILNFSEPDALIPDITCAGSVFLGAYSCESAGDYASGTNHTLPTYGHARAFSGVSVASFQKQITFQKVTQAGAKILGPVVATMAAQEGLDAHKRAMEYRFLESKGVGNLPKYAFLDRDGTLIYEPTDTHQIDSLDRLKVLDGVIEGMQKLQSMGYKLILVSNQDGLGTASLPLEKFETPHQKMLEIFAEKGIHFEREFICSHFLRENCSCRKPKTGLVDNFLKEYGIDREDSVMFGDRETDKQFAQNLGIRFVPMKPNGSFAEAMKFWEGKA